MDGHFALTGSWDGTARVWDLTKSPITSQELTGHTLDINSVAFSPDSRFALTGSNDATAAIWDFTKPAITRYHLKGHTAPIKSVAFSPDSRVALIGSADKNATLWKIESGDKTLSLIDHLLLVKLSKYEHLLIDDPLAAEHLKTVFVKPDLCQSAKRLIQYSYMKAGAQINKHH